MTAVNYFIQDGNRIDYTNGTNADIAYKDIVVGTDRIFVAAENIKVGELGALYAAGVFEFPAKAEALTLGQVVYWDAANEEITKTAKGNTVAGIVTKAKAQAGTEVEVCICCVADRLNFEVVANQAHSAANDVAGVVADLNALLDKFKAAGIMVADA